jgi:hypothetical protein
MSSLKYWTPPDLTHFSFPYTIVVTVVVPVVVAEVVGVEEMVDTIVDVPVLECVDVIDDDSVDVLDVAAVVVAVVETLVVIVVVNVVDGDENLQLKSVPSPTPSTAMFSWRISSLHELASSYIKNPP